MNSDKNTNLEKVAIACSLLLNALLFTAGYSSGHQSASEGAKDSAIVHENQTINNNSNLNSDDAGSVAK